MKDWRTSIVAVQCKDSSWQKWSIHQFLQSLSKRWLSISILCKCEMAFCSSLATHDDRKLEKLKKPQLSAPYYKWRKPSDCTQRKSFPLQDLWNLFSLYPHPFFPPVEVAVIVHRMHYTRTCCLQLWAYSCTSENRLWSRGLKAFLPTPAAEQRGSCTGDHLTQGVSSGCTASAGKRWFLWQLYSTSILFSMALPRQK